jgi:hypothetical protein
MAGHRKIVGLRWARRAQCPWPTTRSRGAKAQGLRYERAIGALLPAGAEHNPWFEFEDANGRGFCSPDFLLAQGVGDSLAILECKYTWVPEAHTQMELLYKPVLQAVFKQPVLAVAICRNLVPAMPGNLVICSSLDQALRVAHAGQSPVWHNLASQLRPRKRPRARPGAMSFVAARAAL